jgi:hypothetical protein
MGGETWKLSPAAVEQIEKQSDVEKGERGESESERERERERKEGRMLDRLQKQEMFRRQKWNKRRRGGRGRRRRRRSKLLVKRGCACFYEKNGRKEGKVNKNK